MRHVKQVWCNVGECKITKIKISAKGWWRRGMEALAGSKHEDWLLVPTVMISGSAGNGRQWWKPGSATLNRNEWAVLNGQCWKVPVVLVVPVIRPLPQPGTQGCPQVVIRKILFFPHGQIRYFRVQIKINKKQYTLLKKKIGFFCDFWQKSKHNF